MKGKFTVGKVTFGMKLLWIGCFLLVWLILSWAATSFLDPDFGWQLKTGEWIWQRREVPRTDLFSYTMPGYPWHYPGWLAEIIFYQLHNFVGYAGLATVISFIAALALMINIEAQLIIFAIVPLLLALNSSLIFVSVRPKIFSFLLMALCFRILKKSEKFIQALLFLPPIFLIWANLHAGFAIGLFILLCLILIDIFKWLSGKRKIKKNLLYGASAVGLSLFSTLINPFGEKIYQEVRATILNPLLHVQIKEWQMLDLSDLSLWLYVLGLLILWWVTRKKSKFSKFELWVSLILLVASLFSRRLIVYFLIFTLPLYAQLAQIAYAKAQKINKFSQYKIYIPLFLLIVIIFSGWTINQKVLSLKNLSEDEYYPAKAMEYLNSNPFSGNLFSVYNWGGYLIWKLPEKKVFVDGRMITWKDNNYSAFGQERQILTGQTDYQPIFEKYEINTVLLPIVKDRKTLADKLTEDGWKKLYEDENAQVLSKPDQNKKN